MFIKKIIQRTLRRLGLELRRTPSPADSLRALFPDLSDAERDIVRSVQPFTMASPERIVNVILAIKYVVQQRVPGDIVECGVWRGGSMMAAALTLRALGDTSRQLYLYDTFEGMSEPTEKDRSADGQSADALLRQEQRGTGIWCCASLDDVRQNLLSTGYPENQIHFVRGKVEDTIPAVMPQAIAWLRLDTDWFESTRHELTHLFPRLQRWGPLIVDDYGHWQGARDALDEFLSQLPQPTFLHRIDYTGRICIKVDN